MFVFLLGVFGSAVLLAFLLGQFVLIICWFSCLVNQLCSSVDSLAWSIGSALLLVFLLSQLVLPL